MPRRKRIFIPGHPYHITARGNHQLPILTTDDERHVYMSIMTRWAQLLGIKVACFVLMLNHIHMIASSPTESGISEWIRNGHREYSKWFNTIRNRGGCNWEGRFYSVLMDPTHCLNALRYVEQNPVRAGICLVAWDWKWSSAAWHAGMGPKPAIVNEDFRPEGTTPKAWRDTLVAPTPEEFRLKLNECIRLGQPLASTEWIERLEARTGLKLSRAARGRPKSAVLA